MAGPKRELLIAHDARPPASNRKATGEPGRRLTIIRAPVESDCAAEVNCCCE
jgi:hypothetical protein